MNPIKRYCVEYVINNSEHVYFCDAEYSDQAAKKCFNDVSKLIEIRKIYLMLSVYDSKDNEPNW